MLWVVRITSGCPPRCDALQWLQRSAHRVPTRDAARHDQGAGQSFAETRDHESLRDHQAYVSTVETHTKNSDRWNAFGEARRHVPEWPIYRRHHVNAVRWI